MEILYYECFAGISGDMNLGAMLDLGVDEALLRGELSKLGLDGEFELRVAPDRRKGIAGTRVDVRLADQAMPHRGLPEVAGIIQAARLSPRVEALALEIFQSLAEAEARVHGVPVEEIHFHEVGATDALVDVVGAAVCREALDVEAVWCSPVELGGGFVDCAHGRLPVPAPATAALLEGIPTTRGAVMKEMTTPTGAAILKTLVDRFEARPSLTVLRGAWGIGQRDTIIPNALRASRARVEAEKNRTGYACLVQCNLDDMTPEQLAVAAEVLMSAGAHDVHLTPVQMKKGRPGVQLSLLCSPAHEERFKRLIFRHTTTLGVKTLRVEKTALRTTTRAVETPLGTIRVKDAWLDGARLRSKPELEDCRALAEAHSRSVAEIQALVRSGS